MLAVTGLGCICAAGDTLAESMRTMYDGHRSVNPATVITSPLTSDFPVFEVPTVSINSEDDTSRTNRFVLAATREALHHSRLDTHDLSKLRVGVCLGTTVGVTLNDEQWYRDYRAGAIPTLRPITRFLANNPALYLSDVYHLSGPIATITNACSSGTDAIGIGAMWLEANMCDIVIAGGADELNRTAFIGFSSLMIASKEACRPFDIQRSGLNLGEGAGICILERRDHAEKRGARMLGYVAGYSSSCDAYHPTGPHPDGKGLRRAIVKAMQSAGIKPEQVGFVNAHGTSTPDNDKVEGNAIHDLLPHSPPVVSTKAYTGHTLGAAGGIEAVFAMQGLLDHQLPATAGFTTPDPACGIIPTTETVSCQAKYSLSLSLAFGGTNSALVLERGAE